jgi:hypothetical protein
MKIYALTVITEPLESFSEVNVTLYETMEKALEAYNEAFDRALEISKDYEVAKDHHEIATERYRWWRIYDLHGTESITIELESKEVM